MKILGARMVVWHKFHTEDLPTLGANTQNLIAWVTWQL